MVPTKALLGVGGVSAVGAGSIGGYLYISYKSNKETFRSKYKQALIQDSEDAIWNKRLTALSTGSPKHEDLVDAKNKNNLISLKTACQKVYDSYFSNDLNDDFKNFCSKHYEDQIGNKSLIATTEDLDNKWTTFKNKTNKDLGGGLLKIYESKKDSSDEPSDWKQLVLDECKNISSSIFEGEIKGYQEFCTKE